MDLIIERLDESHVLSSFSCSNSSLDHWLSACAQVAQERDTGRTWVLHEGDGVAVGYFTLVAHALHRDTLSARQRSSLPREVPAILLAKLAVDVSIRGQGYGGDLLLDALEKCVNAGAIAAARFVVVDAIDEAAATFYEKYGFKRLGSDPMRLVRRLSDIATDLLDDGL